MKLRGGWRRRKKSVETEKYRNDERKKSKLYDPWRVALASKTSNRGTSSILIRVKFAEGVMHRQESPVTSHSTIH